MKREKYKLTTEDFIKKSIEKHGDKYDYSNVVYKNKRTPVNIFCKKHEIIFQQLAGNHMRGQGCPLCGKEIAKKRDGDYKNARKTTEQFKKELLDLFGNKYELLSEYINNKTKVQIYCHNVNCNGEEHGVFEAKPNDLIHKHGCPRCVNSLLEKEIAEFLKENNISFVHNKKFPEWLGKQHLDFYIPKYNIAIECQGRQHYTSVDFGGKGKEFAEKEFLKIKKLDEIKANKCKDNNVKLFYYTREQIKNDNTFNNKQEILENILKIKI